MESVRQKREQCPDPVRNACSAAGTLGHVSPKQHQLVAAHKARELVSRSPGHVARRTCGTALWKSMQILCPIASAQVIAKEFCKTLMPYLTPCLILYNHPAGNYGKFSEFH